ncbi:UL16-binding protein 1-like [Herpailurus yagouaroundi]|uniref:UL16-binding protein 1-like n=1 Tax=Herpailurus yagouaroundi TaxID=1608482 RepID=UPI001AD74A5E|nr:UL16-binding protein 1-like [Puma yagouaroundi]
MARPGDTTLRLCLLLRFLLTDSAPRGCEFRDALSPAFEFPITPKPNPGQPWCEIQGKVNGNTFLYYACGNQKVEVFGPLGRNVNDIVFWERQTETLKDLAEELKKKLLDWKAADFIPSDSLSLQGRLVCVRGDNGRTSGSWEFDINEQISYFFNSESGNWTLRPRGLQIKASWESDRDLTNSLMKISVGDCNKWLERILMHWDELGETTAPPGSQQVTAQSGATALRPITWILPVILSCLIIIGIQVESFRVTGTERRWSGKRGANGLV